MKPIFLVSALCLSFTTAATAITGNELLKTCRSSNQFNRGFCSGAIDGVLSGYATGSISGATRGIFWYLNRDQPSNKIRTGPLLGQSDELIKNAMPYCPPKHITRRQVESIAIEYLANHPKARHKDIDWLLPEVFEAEWPCKK